MCIADAGELEELGRVDRAPAEDHFPGAHDLASLQLDADRPRSLEDDAVDEGPGAHLEVRAAQGGVEVGASCALPPAAVEGAIERGKALLAVAVDVGGQLIARLLCRLEERREEGRGRRPAFEHDRSVAASPLV